MEKILSEKFFLDTNIIVYSFDSSNRQKQKTAAEIIQSGLETGRGSISYQVIQEFLNVARRKFAVPMKPEEAQIFLGMVLKPLCKVFSSIALYSKSLEISDRYRYSFYDSLIISSAQELSCRYLLSEDLKDGQEIEGLKIVNPFL